VKIAVFLSGPPRYVDLVVDQLDSLLEHCSYDYFIHLWSGDTGNKVRLAERFDLERLSSHPKVKILNLQKPYSNNTYEGNVSTEINTHSSLFAVMGMFYSISQLYRELIFMPDGNEYTHVLRMRTDIIILNQEKFLDMLETPDKVYTSWNHGIPTHWISDQICFAPIKKFKALWVFDSMKKLYANFIKAEKNPENTLAKKWKKSGNAGLVKHLSEFIDYSLIYNPPKEYPKWQRDCIGKDGIDALFQNPGNYIDIVESEAINAAYDESMKRWKPYWRKSTLIERLKRKIQKLREK